MIHIQLNGYFSGTAAEALQSAADALAKCEPAEGRTLEPQYCIEVSDTAREGRYFAGGKP